MFVWNSPARRLLQVLLLALITGGALAAPQLLHEKPILSPDKKYAANVEWDDVGFIGLLRMKIHRPNSNLLFSIDLPEINPSPANLAWIDDDWVACESFLGDRGSAFFYVHVPSKRGYLIEIIAPRPNADWIVNLATNDGISSAAIHTLSRDRSSLFPVLLRGLPTDGPDYFTTEFCEMLRTSIDAYSAYRKRENVREIEFLSQADYETSVGAIALATYDMTPYVVYFPVGQTEPKEMLARVQRQPLEPEIAAAFAAIGSPVPNVQWVEKEGGYEIFGTDEDGNTTTPRTTGRFPNVSDTPYTADTAERIKSPAATVTISNPDRKPIPAAKSKSPAPASTTSRNKKPSRSG